MISNIGGIKYLNYRNTGTEEILKYLEKNGYLKVDLYKSKSIK